MSLIVCGLQIQRILWKNISQRKEATPFPEFRPHTQPSKDCLEATACMEKMKDNEVGWWIIYKGSWVQEIENWTCFGLNHKDIYWLTKLEVQCKVGFPVPCGSAAFSHFPTVLQALFSMEWLHVQVGMERLRLEKFLILVDSRYENMEIHYSIFLLVVYLTFSIVKSLLFRD